MRRHECIERIKTGYDFKLDKLSQAELEKVADNVLLGLKLNKKISVPIIDIANKLGFAVNNFPFLKENLQFEGKNVDGIFGVGVEFDINENSNFILIEKELENIQKRFVVSYLLAHYILKLNENEVEQYFKPFSREDISTNQETRLALCMLMPKDIFLAEYEFLKLAYKTADANSVLTYETVFKELGKIFEVNSEMIKIRMKTLHLKTK